MKAGLNIEKIFPISASVSCSTRRRTKVLPTRSTSISCATSTNPSSLGMRTASELPLLKTLVSVCVLLDDKSIYSGYKIKRLSLKNGRCLPAWEQPQSNTFKRSCPEPDPVTARAGRMLGWMGYATRLAHSTGLGVRRHRVGLGNSVVSRHQTALASDGAKKMSASMSKRHDLTHLVITLSRFQRCRSCSKHASSSPPQHLHLSEMRLDKESGPAQRCADA